VRAARRDHRLVDDREDLAAVVVEYLHGISAILMSIDEHTESIDLYLGGEDGEEEADS
jgi:hypothetical protein